MEAGGRDVNSCGKAEIRNWEIRNPKPEIRNLKQIEIDGIFET
jgi:hypothetical protein